MKITIRKTKKRIDWIQKEIYCIFQLWKNKQNKMDWGVITPLNYFIWPAFEISETNWIWWKWIFITWEGYIWTKKQVLEIWKREKSEFYSEWRVLQFPFTF